MSESASSVKVCAVSNTHTHLLWRPIVSKGIAERSLVLHRVVDTSIVSGRLCGFVIPGQYIMHFSQKSYFRVLQRPHEEVGLVLVALDASLLAKTVQFTSDWNIFVVAVYSHFLPAG